MSAVNFQNQSRENDIEMEDNPPNNENQMHNESVDENPCVRCRAKTRLTSFDRGQLIPGDHIEMNGRSCCLGHLYDHHAIFAGLTEEGNIKVIDVPNKNYCSFENAKCCTEKSFKVQYSTYDLDCREIKRNDYRHRKNNHAVTLKVAEEYKTSGINEYYCLCFRNCEHFAVKCVVNEQGAIQQSPTTTNTMSCSCTSIQVTVCLGRLFQLMLAIFLTVLYIFNFYIYAILAAKDSSFNHFSQKHLEWVEHNCASNMTTRGFQTHCDWYALIIVEFWYVVTFMTMIIYQFGFITNKCRQCLMTFTTTWTFKGILIAVFEITNIYLEKYLYMLLSCINGDVIVTYVVIIVIGILEMILVYMLSHTFAKIALYMFGNRWCKTKWKSCLSCGSRCSYCETSVCKCCLCLWYPCSCGCPCRCYCDTEIEQSTYLYV